MAVKRKLSEEEIYNKALSISLARSEANKGKKNVVQSSTRTHGTISDPNKYKITGSGANATITGPKGTVSGADLISGKASIMDPSGAKKKECRYICFWILGKKKLCRLMPAAATM